MTPRFLNTLPLLGVLLLAACGPVSCTDAHLNDIESYINEAPDSARAALQAMDTTALRTKRLRARYSLLRTMAQDKCYDDIMIPGLLDDAAWFERHGMPDERMKLWYYRGRILLNEVNANEAAIAFSRAESYADQVQDQHALGLLYLSMQSVYNFVYNRVKEQEYSEKAIEIFKRTNDPAVGPALGFLAMVYHEQQKWALADSVYREAMPYFEVVPTLAPGFLSDYATMKMLQPVVDPEGAIALLDRYRELSGSFGVNEAGVYAYALELLGRKTDAEPIIAELRRTEDETAQYSALVWLARIDRARGEYESAFWEQAEVFRRESTLVQETLEDSVTQALRDDASRQAAAERERRRNFIILAGGIFFALLSAFLLLLLRKGKIEAERNHLVDLREQMQSELEKVQEEKAEKEKLLSGQEDRIREMEAHVARERETYTRERVNRLRQLGELRSTFWWRERGGMRESDAIQRIKKEISYVYQTDNNGVALVRRLDDELDGAITQLRKSLHLRGKPQEVLFLCCCILDLEPEMIAEIMNTSKANVYEKRSRLRARIRSLGDPLLSVLVEK
ncbi:MAG: hypothetical protein IKQ76_00085 [Bacteroidales bacterium]|nr:hypothetical protein [Bacteroidales bacterium]